MTAPSDIPAGQQPAPAAPSRWARVRHIAWPVAGFLAAAFCLFLLGRELRHISPHEVMQSLRRIPPLHVLGALCGAIVAYGSLAAYDRIALLYLGRKLPWPFIAVTSFVAYALSHNLGVAILSGAVVRYRAYSSRGLTRRGGRGAGAVLRVHVRAGARDPRRAHPDVRAGACARASCRSRRATPK